MTINSYQLRKVITQTFICEVFALNEEDAIHDCIHSNLPTYPDTYQITIENIISMEKD